MALPDFFRIQPGTAFVFRKTGGDAAITFASLANSNGTSTGAVQSATLNLGSNWARLWRLGTEFEFAATPTAGNVVDIFASFYNTTGNGVGNTTGSDAPYTGYSNNIDAAVRHLTFLGSHVCTAQATTTVQRANSGIFMPTGQYMNLVVVNRAGSAFHSTETNQLIRITPLFDVVTDT